MRWLRGDRMWILVSKALDGCAESDPTSFLGHRVGCECDDGGDGDLVVLSLHILWIL